jgi:hypothetical protein
MSTIELAGYVAVFREELERCIEMSERTDLSVRAVRLQIPIITGLYAVAGAIHCGGARS